MKQKRDEKFIGGLIAGIGSLLGGILSNVATNRATNENIKLAEQQLSESRKLKNEARSAETMSGIQNLYNNEDSLNNYYNRFSNASANNLNTSSSLRCGGIKKKKRCGGKKADFGTFMKENSENIMSTVGGLLNGISSIQQAAGQAKVNNIMAKANAYNPTSYSFSGYSGDTYKDRFSSFRCGGKKRK